MSATFTTSTTVATSSDRSGARRLAVALIVMMVACSPVYVQTVETLPDFELKTLDGQTRTFADFAGPVTLINFFFPT